jgi:glycogen debranching enzyme
VRFRQVVSIAFLLVCELLAPASLRADELTWSTDAAQPGRFVAARGQRAGIFGYSENGLEIWAYPLQLIDSFNVSFRQRNGTTETPGRTALRRIEYRPEAVTRIYVGPDFVVREKLFVPIDAPAAIVTYEVEGVRPIDILVRFNPVLNLMWPGAIGGQEASWQATASGYLLTEPLHRYSAFITSPDLIAHDETPNANRPITTASGLAFTIRASKDDAAGIVIAADVSGKDPIPVAQEVLRNRATLEQTAVTHYKDMLDRGLRIQTPDDDINRALTWAQIALDQAWVCNPDLGCGQVAGYGPSRKARRPQYNWFFAGDGMIAARALLAAGRNERAREELELVLKYQDVKTGMIWHELSQSAGAIDWHKYPYMFGHVDLSYDFLDMIAEYYSTTGDLAFVKKHWHAIEAAYRFCQSLLDPKLGLPLIPTGKQGSNEQDPLGDELTLSSGWVAATEAYAALATATGRDSLAKTAMTANQRARTAIASKYWDEHRKFWISGHTRAGAPQMDRDIRPMDVIRLGLFEPQQRHGVLDQIATAEFQTDWGTRGKAPSDATYDPNAYASGAVWGIGTASVASAFWTEHRPATAFPIWNALVSWHTLDSLGHMHETLAGDTYRPGIESVPEQTWSSATFLSSAVQGLMGLRVDGAARRLQFTPHLPADWNKVTLRKVRIGDSQVSFDLAQSPGAIELRIKNDGAPLRMSFDPELPLGAELRSARLNEQEIAATLVSHSQDSHAHAEFDVAQGDAVLRIGYSGGVSIITSTPRPLIGNTSREMKVVGVSLQRRTYTMEVDHLTSEQTRFELHTPWGIENVSGARFEEVSRSSYALTIDKSPDAETRAYRRSKVIVSFASSR